MAASFSIFGFVLTFGLALDVYYSLLSVSMCKSASVMLELDQIYRSKSDLQQMYYD